MQQQLTLGSEAGEGVAKFASASGVFPLSELATIFEDASVAGLRGPFGILTKLHIASSSNVRFSEGMGPRGGGSGWPELSILGSRMHKNNEWYEDWQQGSLLRLIKQV